MTLVTHASRHYSFSYPLDSNIMKKSGRILIVAELAREYGFKDVGGMLVYLVSNSGEFDQAMICIILYFIEWWTIQNTCMAQKQHG